MSTEIKNEWINWSLEKLWDTWKKLEEINDILLYLGEHETQGLRLILRRIAREISEIGSTIQLIHSRVANEAKMYEKVIEDLRGEKGD
jgi:hypothetical protein